MENNNFRRNVRTETNAVTETAAIKALYNSLLNLIAAEAKLDPAIKKYYEFLDEYRFRFASESNVECRDELIEFIRGASRYMDEFEFSQNLNMKIQNTLNRLYNLLIY